MNDIVEWDCEIHTRCDSSAARGMSARQGLATARHVEVRFSWLQQAVQEGCFKVFSVPTSENLSDTFTKSLSQADADRCHRCMNFHMGNVGSGRYRKVGQHMESTCTESITSLNELETTSDVSGNSEA